MIYPARDICLKAMILQLQAPLGKIAGDKTGKAASALINPKKAAGSANSRKHNRKMRRINNKAGKEGANAGSIIGSSAGSKASHTACDAVEKC